MKHEQVSMAELYNIKGRNPLEKWLNKYNHIMEFFRTMSAIIMIALQLYIISQLL